MEGQVYVFKICDCDAVAALTLEDAIEWYKKETGVDDDELYPYDEVETMSPDHLVYADVYDSEEVITLSELIEQEWKGEPFIACSTEW